VADILLLEPNYKNKYPPLGLMKIAYFHKNVHHDYVRFAKGTLPETFSDKKWDRVYVTTLFTFEWENTRKTIEYAYTIVKDSSQVYTGGILATLMPELIQKEFPNINLNVGLLNRKGTLGLSGEEFIDTITPDYSMLDDIKDEYIYPAHDAYFLYMTRGCGMRCEFCAVQTLEPKYIPYISIRDIIARIDAEFGPKKDLLLMDNNVLRSPDFDLIIDEIKELGFAKGASHINPKTGKKVQRFIDFNQGLDAFLLNEHKAKRLGELALKPARIAFDHIEDQTAYEKAIRLCAKNGITHMSNYLLYNGDSFQGKGHTYKADTPEDLFNRMKFTMDLGDKLNNEFEHGAAIFSFPMRYIPLSATKRGYIGPEWNAKYLRALQCMLIPTQGKGVSSRSFFEADFGITAKDFIRFMAMPEFIISRRGHFVERKGEAENDTYARKQEWINDHSYIVEWNRLFNKVDQKRFLELIADNIFSTQKFETINEPNEKKLLLHYYSVHGLLHLLSNEDTGKFIKDYLDNEFELIYNKILDHIISTHIPHTQLNGLLNIYNQKLIRDIFATIDISNHATDYLLDSLNKSQAKLGIQIFDMKLAKYITIYFDANVFSNEHVPHIKDSLQNLDEKGIRKMLLKNINILRDNLLGLNTNQVGHEHIANEIEQYISDFRVQLTLFDEVY